jgi:predicted neutral ceramidase superfamily lipid hydrolase
VQIKWRKLVLWCYLIWYFVTLYFHFDKSPALWINSLGISLVIGTALMLSVAGHLQDYWQTFRLYWMPFAVSSFAALIKNKHYFVIFSPQLFEVLTAVACCLLFLCTVVIIKYSASRLLNHD